MLGGMDGGKEGGKAPSIPLRLSCDRKRMHAAEAPQWRGDYVVPMR
jgi:hypothetical protein